MKSVIQRVSRAEVRVSGEPVGTISTGLAVLVGVGREDTDETAEWMAGRISTIRLFPSDGKPIDRSVTDVGGEVLAISQFTLLADCRRGRRPSFEPAARSEQAEPIFDHFVASLRAEGVSVKTGRFGADMDVELVNDGPVTILLDSDGR